MRPSIHGETMNAALHRYVSELSEVVLVVLLEYRDEAAPAGNVGPPDTWIELHHIRTGWQR